MSAPTFIPDSGVSASGSSSRSKRRPAGLGVTDACRTALVTTSETSSSAQVGLVGVHLPGGERGRREPAGLGDHDRLGGEGPLEDREVFREERNTRIAMSSSMSPGTAVSAATASASADAGAASSASRSMATASVSV